MVNQPTSEQAVAIDIARGGQTCVIQALAGTGKTSTLRMIAENTPTRRYQFMAFNKQIVTDVQGSFPENVSASTVHSLAFQSLGKTYAHRLQGGRMKGGDMARLLRIQPISFDTPGGFKRLAAGFLAGLVRRSIDVFCQSADVEPSSKHVPLMPGLDAPRELMDGTKVNARGPNHAALAVHLEPHLRAYWHDVLQVMGALPFSHGHYLKMWELSHPVIPADTILFDEAQDASPVMLSIIQQQQVQLIVVGDSNQAIYGWTGAIDALDRVDPSAPRTWLTSSFRFGQEIADEANGVLSMLHTPQRLVGLGQPGEVGHIDKPDCVLYRTNAGAVGYAMSRLAVGERVAIAGGAEDVQRFMKGAQELQTTGWSSHPDLQCFNSWVEVQEYVMNDPNGSELKTLVDLVEKYSLADVIRALSALSKEEAADVVVSTAHKSKGRQWPLVRLGGDFPDPEERGGDIGDEELRLIYVATTRAMEGLDIDAVALLSKGRV